MPLQQFTHLFLPPSTTVQSLVTVNRLSPAFRERPSSQVEMAVALYKPFSLPAVVSSYWMPCFVPAEVQRIGFCSQSMRKHPAYVRLSQVGSGIVLSAAAARTGRLFYENYCRVMKANVKPRTIIRRSKILAPQSGLAMAVVRKKVAPRWSFDQHALEAINLLANVTVLKPFHQHIERIFKAKKPKIFNITVAKVDFPEPTGGQPNNPIGVTLMLASKILKSSTMTGAFDDTNSWAVVPYRPQASSCDDSGHLKISDIIQLGAFQVVIAAGSDSAPQKDGLALVPYRPLSWVATAKTPPHASKDHSSLFTFLDFIQQAISRQPFTSLIFAVEAPRASWAVVPYRPLEWPVLAPTQNIGSLTFTSPPSLTLLAPDIIPACLYEVNRQKCMAVVLYRPVSWNPVVPELSSGCIDGIREQDETEYPDVEVASLLDFEGSYIPTYEDQDEANSPLTIRTLCPSVTCADLRGACGTVSPENSSLTGSKSLDSLNLVQDAPATTLTCDIELRFSAVSSYDDDSIFDSTVVARAQLLQTVEAVIELFQARDPFAEIIARFEAPDPVAAVIEGIQSRDAFDEAIARMERLSPSPQNAPYPIGPAPPYSAVDCHPWVPPIRY